MFQTSLGHDFKVKSLSYRAPVPAPTREKILVDIANLNQSRLFGDGEDAIFKEEEIALSGFEIGFETFLLG